MNTLNDSLTAFDPDIAALIDGELRRQESGLEMIASENYAPLAVMQAQGSVLTNKYARRSRRRHGIPGHFPTKEALFQAVIADRMHRIIDKGHALLKSKHPGDALFAFLRSMVLQWGATDRGLVEALAGVGIEISSAAPEAEADFLDLLTDLLRAAQRAGTVRPDVDVLEVKTLLVGCQAMQSYNAELAAKVTDVALDGLRANRK